MIGRSQTIMGNSWCHMYSVLFAESERRLTVRGQEDGPQCLFDQTSVSLRPHSVFGQCRIQLAKVERRVEFLVFDVTFDLRDLLAESLAILVVLLIWAHVSTLLHSRDIGTRAHGKV